MSLTESKSMQLFSLYVVFVFVLLAGCESKELIKEVDALSVDYGVQSIAWHPDGERMAVGYFMKDEVAVWNINTKQMLFTVPSKRRPINSSGQEVIFSRDGKYLIVQDTVDTKNGVPPFSKIKDSPEDLATRADEERLILARIWDLESRVEVAQIKGPGSRLHDGSHLGMCWIGNQINQLAVLRRTVISVYESPSGKKLYDVDLSYPFKDDPDKDINYKKMDCHPSKPEIALEGNQFWGEVPKLGRVPIGITPIVIADMQRRERRVVVFSSTGLSGISYSVDGKRLVSRGGEWIRTWNVDKNYAADQVIETSFKSTGYLTSIPETDGMLGLGDGHLHFWDFSKPGEVLAIRGYRDIYRIAVSKKARRVAIAEGRRIHFYVYQTDKSDSFLVGREQKW